MVKESGNEDQMLPEGTGPLGWRHCPLLSQPHPSPQLISSLWGKNTEDRAPMRETSHKRLESLNGKGRLGEKLWNKRRCFFDCPQLPTSYGKAEPLCSYLPG